MKAMTTTLICLNLSLVTSCSGGSSDDTSPIECDDQLEDSGIQLGSIDSTCACREATLEPGSNEFPDDWYPITDGSEVVVVHGPQGGWHIWGSAKAHNTRNVVQIDIEVYDIPSGAMIAENGYHVALIKEDTCTGSYPGMFAFVNVDSLTDSELGLDTPPELICYHPLRIEMTATDSGGRVVTKSVEVVGVPDPSDVDDCVIDAHSVTPQ